MTTVTLAILCGLVAVVYGFVTSQQVLRASPGDARMQDIAAAIQEGERPISAASTPPSRSLASLSPRSCF